MQDKIQSLINYIANTFLAKGLDGSEFNTANNVLFGGTVLYIVDDNLNRFGTIYIEKENAVYVHNDQDRTNFIIDEEYAVAASELLDEMSFEFWREVHLFVGEVSPEHLIHQD